MTKGFLWECEKQRKMLTKWPLGKQSKGMYTKELIHTQEWLWENIEQWYKIKENTGKQSLKCAIIFKYALVVA